MGDIRKPWKNENEFKKFLGGCIEEDERQMKSFSDSVGERKERIKTPSRPELLEWRRIALAMCEDMVRHYNQIIIKERKLYKQRYGYEYEAKPKVPGVSQSRHSMMTQSITDEQEPKKSDDLLSDEFREWLCREKKGARDEPRRDDYGA